MATSYRDALEHIRRAFPQPVSDPIHDSYFVHSIMRALDQVDDLKMQLPTLGPVVSGDFAEAQNAELPAEMSSVEAVTSDLVSYLRGITISSHPHTQQNVIAPPTISQPHRRLTRLVAQSQHRLGRIQPPRRLGRSRISRHHRANGWLRPTTSWRHVYLRRDWHHALWGKDRSGKSLPPGHGPRAYPKDVVVLVSDAGHYCAHNIVGWLGIGTDQLIVIPTIAENEIDLAQLEDAARAALDSGKKIAAIIATMGTTDAFGLDDLQAIVAMRDSLVDEFQLSYRPHIHADSVIGWAWSVFNDYDFQDNPLEFRPRTLRALAGACRRIRHLALADSMGIDFHKTGFAPYISSLVLVKDRADLQLLMRDPQQMPYLYHFGDHRPGMYTLETSRAGTGPLTALANFRFFGEQGLRVALGHIVEMTQLLREHLEGHEAITVLKPRQLWHGNALPGISTRRGYFCD